MSRIGRPSAAHMNGSLLFAPSLGVASDSWLVGLVALLTFLAVGLLPRPASP